MDPLEAAQSRASASHSKHYNHFCLVFMAMCMCMCASCVSDMFVAASPTRSLSTMLAVSPGTFGNFCEQVADGCRTPAHANVTAILRRDSCMHAYKQRARCMDCARPSANL